MQRKMQKTELLYMEPVQDLIELTLGTAYVRHEKPVSLTIVAEPESGKTEIMKKYRQNHGVYSTRKFSAYGIQRELIEGKINVLFDKPKILGHIMIYDFAALNAFKPSTVDSTIAFLDALTEEGLEPESSYAIDPEDLEPYRGLKGGVIAGVNTLGFFTSDSKKRIKANMLKGGWFSRNVVASYEITGSQLKEIFKAIREGKYRDDEDFVNLIALDFPEKRKNVEISKKHCKEIEAIVEDIKEELRDYFKRSIKGIRLYKALICLVKASALRDGRYEVQQKDVERIKYLSEWMNLRYNELPRNRYPYPW